MTGTPMKGTFAVAVEPSANPGRQLIFANAAIAATQSATNQPSGSTGCRLTITVQNIVSGASATVTIAGLAPDGVTVVSETTTAISTATANVNNIYTYTTKAIYGSINASGITASSVTSNALSSATLTVHGTVAGKFLAPATVLINEDFGEYSPADLRGLLDEDIRMLQLTKKVTVDAKTSVYPENCEYIAAACVGNATNPATRASIPATPTSLKVSTAFSTLSPSYTLTTQPTSPGMELQFVIAGNALAGTLTITGVSSAANGSVALSEVISVTAATPNGTFYTAPGNVYASVTSIAVTGFTGTATCTTKGVFAYNPIYNPTDTLASLAGEWYSGTESSIIPFFVPETWEFDYDVNKEITLTMKGPAQTKLTIGDRTPTSLTTTNFNAYAQPLDFPLPGWGALFYLDPLTGTLGATQWLDVITFKIKGKTGVKPYWTATGSQDYNRVGRGKRKVEFDAEIDFTNVILYDQYRAFQKQQILVKFQSIQAYLGNNAGTPIYKTMQWVLYPRLVKFDLDPKDEKVIGKLQGTCEYEPSVGYSHQVSYINLNNPSYLS